MAVVNSSCYRHHHEGVVVADEICALENTMLKCAFRYNYSTLLIDASCASIVYHLSKMEQKM